MKSARWKLIGIAAAVVVIAIATWCLWPASGPYYNGKPIAYWFRQYYLVGQGNDTAYKQEELDKVLHEFGSNALPYLVQQALSTAKDTSIRSNFYELLAKLPDSWHPPPFVSHDDIRQEAVDAISEINPNAHVLLPYVREALDSPNEMQRLWALRAVDTIADDYEIFLPWFLKALKSTNVDCVEIGLRNVQMIGTPEAKSAVPDVLAILTGGGKKYEMLHEEAVKTLGEIGGDASPALPVLVKLFESEKDWSEKKTVATALCQIDAQQTNAFNYLIEKLKLSQEVEYYGASSAVMPRYASDATVEAADQIALIGTNARAAIPALVECLTSTNTSVKTSAAVALHKIGAPNELFLPKLEEQMKRSDAFEKVKIASAILLAIERTNHAAVMILTDAMKGDSASQRRALSSLFGFGLAPSEMVPLLKEALNSPDPIVHDLADRMLREIEDHKAGR